MEAYMVNKPDICPVDLVELAEADKVGKLDTNIEAKDQWGYITDS